MSSDQLIPIENIVKSATENGVTFGFGSPKNHLSYLSKLHLIPSAIRRKLADGKISGCYPESVISTLQKIEQLKNQGLTYSQIKAQLSIINSNTQVQANKFNLALAYSGPIFLIIGILLGYLLATSAVNKNNVLGTEVGTAAQANDFQKILRLSTSPNSDQSIYLISVPNNDAANQGLYKLGKTTLNNLTN